MKQHLVSATDLRLALNLDNTSELHKAMVIKHIANAEMITITCKVVPLVNVNAIPLIGNDLETQQ